jgi:hypothetical protein
VGDLVGGVDEGEHPDPGELLAQRVHQQQGEVAESGHRSRHIAQHNEFRARWARLAQHDVDRTPPVDIDLRSVLRRSICRPGAGGAWRPAGWPGCAPAAHGLAHLAQLVAGGAQELDVLGQLRDAVHLNVVATQLLGGAPLGLRFDHLAQLRDALGGNRFGDLLLGGVASSPYGASSPASSLPSSSSSAIALSA